MEVIGGVNELDPHILDSPHSSSYIHTYTYIYIYTRVFAKSCATRRVSELLDVHHHLTCTFPIHATHFLLPTSYFPHTLLSLFLSISPARRIHLTHFPSFLAPFRPIQAPFWPLFQHFGPFHLVWLLESFTAFRYYIRIRFIGIQSFFGFTGITFSIDM